MGMRRRRAAAAMVGRSMASQGQRKRSPQKPQAADRCRRTDRGRDGVGRGRYGVGRGRTVCGKGGIHSRGVAKGSRASRLILYGKFLLSCECVRWFLLYQPLEIFSDRTLFSCRVSPGPLCSYKRYHWIRLITPQSKAKVPLTVL